ncbi:hypothetical protein Pint_13146 [Pistacia integerrima]|uniref:Uncharacterized protein n=1 Tax=Pistacia integerrima TaxID=434235 RepID=A0ACC0YCB0_9ROSI|nr:hypothetical protein Pint_13146 [Pistacia integerrima]
MDNTQEDARYSSKPYSLNRQKFPSYSRPIKNRFQYEEDDEDEDIDAYIEEKNEDEEYGVEFGETNGHRHNFKESENFERYPKRQKVRTAVSGYQFAPRSVKLSYDWTEHEAFVLLEIWGDRFLQLGRKSLRSEDWVEVSEKVTEALKTEKEEAQCRRMMDELKRKYKKEKVKVEQMGVNSSKWVFFKKMDMLMDMRRECGGLACGLDSGEFVFMDTRVYLDRSNGFDEMRDSPTESEMEEDEEEEDNNEESSASLMMLADSVNKFGEIYEKIESSKREQMMELERMRMDFHREMELQKKQILERAQAEIATIREADDDDDDEDTHDDDDDDDDDGEGDSMENLSE